VICIGLWIWVCVNSFLICFPVYVDEDFTLLAVMFVLIASFKTSVDVLKLSAAPIPQTLYLALTRFHDAR